jgi:anti-sigma regulatory factor (Ser/Thr protein kinase)
MVGWRAMSVNQAVLDPRDHVVQFYDCDGVLVEAVGEYLASGLRDGDVAVVIATPEHAAAFVEALGECCIDAERAVRSGSLVVLDAGETLATFMLDDRPDIAAFDTVIGNLLRRAGEGGRRVRAYGEMVALLWESGNVAGAIDLEDLWNALGSRVAFSLFCAYPSQPTAGDGDAFNHVCHAHSAVLGLGPDRASDSEPPANQAPTQQARQFPASENAPRAARNFVAATLHRWNLDHLVAEAAIVVTELATNAVRHARTEFVVAIAARANGVEIAVRDGSRTPPVAQVPDTSPLTGRGVLLVSALAHAWGTQDLAGGKLVWAELRP